MEFLGFFLGLVAIFLGGVIGVYAARYISHNLVYKPERDDLFENLAKKYNLEFTKDVNKSIFTLENKLKGQLTARTIQGAYKNAEILIGDYAQALQSFNLKRNIQYAVSPLITRFFVNKVEQFPTMSFFSPLATEEQISAFLDSLQSPL